MEDCKYLEVFKGVNFTSFELAAGPLTKDLCPLLFGDFSKPFFFKITFLSGFHQTNCELTLAKMPFSFYLSKICISLLVVRHCFVNKKLTERFSFSFVTGASLEHQYLEYELEP